MEDYLLGQFANSIDSNFVFDNNLQHVDDIKKKPTLSIDTESAPYVT